MRLIGDAATGLFPSFVLPLPFQEESLYGWCGRFHRLSGNVIPDATSRQLFGHPTAGLRHDFPSHLDHLQMVTRNLFGSVSDLIYQRTQFAFYAPFLDAQRGQAIVNAMRDRGHAGIQQSLGLTRSGLGPMAPLKACRACMEEDKATVPTAWWHMQHQWDPIRVCLRHRQPLLVASDRLHTNGLRAWHLPRDLQVDQWQPAPIVDSVQLNRLARIAQWTHALLEHREFRYEGPLLRHSYLLQAKAHGLIAMDGALRLAALRDSFSKAHQGLDLLAGLSFLNRVTDMNGGFLGFLLREFPGSRHPIKHIYLMAHLFAEPEEFFARYKEVKSIADAEGVAGLDKQLRDIRTRLREMVGVEGKSVNSACRELGIPPTQAIRLLRKEGIPYKRRPRVLTSDTKERLDGMLKTGAERRDIATVLGIRKAFIKDYLAERPELRATWEMAYETKRTAEYREHFLKVLQDNPGVPIKRIRNIPGNGFQWLFNNDLDWLKENLPGIWRRASD